MKKFLLLLLVPYIIFAEDIYFKVIETTPYWLDYNFPQINNISGEIMEGEIVKGYGGLLFAHPDHQIGILENTPLQRIMYNNREMVVFANSLLPLETQDLFEKNLLYDLERPIIFSFYVNALQVNNREIIYLHDKTYWDMRIIHASENNPVGVLTEWWKLATAYRDLTITQTAINIIPDVKYWSYLIIKNIQKTNEGYNVTVKEVSIKDPTGPWKWSSLQEGELFTLLLIPDGDYIDLYYRDKNTLVDTFVFVNNEFINQVNNLIKGNPVDLTNISWPRRADGSMDYPPPNVGIDNTDNQTVEVYSDIENDIVTETEFSSNEVNSQPVWLWLAIAAGVIVIAGGAVLVVVRRKKKL